MSTILIIGGTSGIGAAFAAKFYSMNKKVIITGRRQARLSELKASLAGIETYQFDCSDLASIPTHVGKIFKTYPDIDTVWVNAGVQYSADVKDAASTSDAKIAEEVIVNVTAPMVLAHHVVPRLLEKGRETTFMITGSGLGFVPVGSMFPVYCSTKAAVHAYCVGMRQALKGTNVNVLELVPPFVGGTELGSDHNQKVLDQLKKLTPMTMKDYVRETFEALDGQDGKDLREVGAGSAIPRIDAWRSGVGEILVKSGLGG